MTELPKVLSTISFKNAIIDKYKNIMGLDVPSSTTFTDGELLFTEDRFSEKSDVPSHLDSDFKFVGDETDPYQVVRRAPDFDSVIVLLGELHDDKLKQQLSSVSISEEKLERAKERTQRLEDLKESLPEYDFEKLMEAERLQLLKDMGPPWLLLYLFSKTASRDRSFNYIEETSLEDEESIAGYSNDSYELRGAHKLDRSPEPEMSDEEDDAEIKSSLGRRRSSYSIPASVRSRMSSVYSSSTRIANEVLSRIICMVDEAIIDGVCELSVKSITSFVEQKSHEDTNISPQDFGTLRDFLVEAEKKDLQVKDLNELYHFFVGESFKATGENIDDQKRNRSREITSIFEASGIEVDNTLLDAHISENMILGLVHKDPEDHKEHVPSNPTVEVTDDEPKDEEADEGASALEQELHTLVEVVEEAEPEQEAEPAPDVATQTDPLNVKCMEMMRRRSLTRSADVMVEFSCRLPALPGIGPPLDEGTIETFLAYLTKRAVHQHGMIYPRNFREPPCPKLDSGEGEGK